MKRIFAAVLAGLSIAIASPAFAEKPDILETIVINGEIDRGMAEMVTQKVAEMNDNQRVKAVLLSVDSPGGGVLPSAVIYEELSKLKVPVVGFCENICASGGMYILMAPTVKYIGVRTQTVSGSIGVVMHITRYNRLLEFAKIDSATYKSGVSKDTGNPTRAETPEDQVELQDEINTLAGRFYDVVKKARPKISADHFETIKTARVFFGDEGVKVGLVDAVMSKDEAIKKAKSLSGVTSIFTREELKKMSKDGGEPSYSYAQPDMARGLFNDLQYGMEWLKEIRAGGGIKVEYRAPYSF